MKCKHLIRVIAFSLLGLLLGMETAVADIPANIQSPKEALATVKTAQSASCQVSQKSLTDKIDLVSNPDIGRSGLCAVCPHGYTCKCDHATGTCACYIKQPHYHVESPYAISKDYGEADIAQKRAADRSNWS